MKLTPPKTITFWIAVVIAVVGMLAQMGTISSLPISAFWLVGIAFVLLAVANLTKGL